MLTKELILEYLEEVKDPEIPVISLVDLGVISDVQILEQEVWVELTPTFAGCPAIEYMRKNVEEVLQKKGIPSKAVINYNKVWSSDFITEKGLKQLQEFGLAKPAKTSEDLLKSLQNVECPKCHSTNTQLLNPFGPTLCRAIHHCHNCKETFEQFKTL
ncbi:MAG: phenylacetate-CoA oxygenase subunit PaaJ [Bacteroidia bacterium]|nr:MAG: phenylacetate-CoA oxygenase subunit PaaJ [Bacteroidia bacterium]